MVSLFLLSGNESEVKRLMVPHHTSLIATWYYTANGQKVALDEFE